jgi:N-acyl amino acid synthase of PEP-CTERM/exosortase system
MPERHKMSLVAKYKKHFRVVRADTPELLEEAQRMRFDIYCRELRYVDPFAHADGLEKDAHDPASSHCLLFHKTLGAYAGCVRLVLADPENPDAPFPFEKQCGDALWRRHVDPAEIPRHSFGEISRLAIRKEFRRRSGEAKQADGFARNSGTPEESAKAMNVHLTRERRHSPHMVLVLYLAAASVALNDRLESVFAMMDPRLARHLLFAGIKFEQVGDPVDFRGLRAAYRITRQGLYGHLKPEVKDLLDAVREDLVVPGAHPKLQDLHC